jgi:SP family sugar:H+ symporter-like MFS transporter
MRWLNTDARKYFNRQLALSCSLIALSSFNYAFDNQGYAQSQAMDAFTETFGEYNAAKGKYALNTQWLAFFNGFPYLAFAVGMIPARFQIQDEF